MVAKKLTLPFDTLLPVGVAPFSLFKERLLSCRAKSRLPDKAKSVIVYLFPYYLGEEYYLNLNMSRYAVPSDYHVVVNEYLTAAKELLKAQYEDFEFSEFADNSPIPEVGAAVAAGLGERGRNGLLLNREYGSFCFIGEIVTDMVLPYSVPAKPELCTGCSLCIKNCPSGANDGEKIDRTLCLSAVSQKKGELTEKEKELIKKGGSVWGCDICQTVCPVNSQVKITPLREFFDTAAACWIPGSEIEGRAYAWRGKEPIQRNFKILCCNPKENQL